MTHSEHTSASPRVALAPDTSRLDPRAARAWTQRMAVTPLDGGQYAIHSESGRSYVVDLPEGTCTCPDHAIRGERCKHLRRVAIEISEGLLPPPGKREARCANCHDRAFVPEDADPPLCPDCEVAPDDLVRDRETGDLLTVVEVTPRRAYEWSIPGTEHTVATYPKNEDYPSDAVVVRARYPSQRTGGRDAYAFPLSRLQRVDDPDERTD